MTISIVGSTASVQAGSSAAPATGSLLVDGLIGDFGFFFVSWGVDYVDGSYFDDSARPTLTGPGASRAVYVGTMIGGVDYPTETWGLDAGKRGVSIWWVPCTSATGADDTLVFNSTGSGTNRMTAASATRIRMAAGKVPDVAWTAGEDKDKPSTLNFQGFTNVGATAADWIVGAVAIVPDNVNPTLTLGWPGCTLGTQSNIASGGVTTGHDIRMLARNALVSSGSATGAPTLTSTTTGNAGAAIILRVREGDPPAATMNAGPDQSNVEPYTTVTLDSSGSTGVTAGRTWTQTAGTAVALSSTSAVSPTFTSPGTLAGTTLTFRVTDDTSATFDDVTVTVLASSRRVKLAGVMTPVQRRMA